jgi:DNA-binding CsgD family transcriptional regulator
LATVRTHLAHVFDKTGTRRQAELVRLILQSRPATAAD